MTKSSDGVVKDRQDVAFHGVQGQRVAVVCGRRRRRCRGVRSGRYALCGVRRRGARGATGGSRATPWRGAFAAGAPGSGGRRAWHVKLARTTARWALRRSVAGGRSGRAPALVRAAVAQERDEVRRVAHLAAAQGRGRRGRPRVRPPDRREVRGVEATALRLGPRRRRGAAAFLLGFRFEHLHRDAAEAPEDPLQRHRVGRAGAARAARPRRFEWRRGSWRAAGGSGCFSCVFAVRGKLAKRTRMPFPFPMVNMCLGLFVRVTARAAQPLPAGLHQQSLHRFHAAQRVGCVYNSC